MKTPLTSLIFAITTTFVFASSFSPSGEDAVSLVESTAFEIEANAPSAINRIIKGEEPFRNAQNRDFYVFVFNEEVITVAHPLKMCLWKTYKHEKDNNGKKYRLDAVNGAVKNNSGWIIFNANTEDGKKDRKTFYKLIKGSDNKKYIVCCDIDKPAGE